MRRIARNALVCVGIVLAALSLTTATASRLVWGHWFSPPSSDVTASRFETVERFATFGWGGPASSGPRALRKAAGKENWTSGEWPGGRLPAALDRRGLTPSSTGAVPAEILDDVASFLDSSGLLVDGDPYYTDTKHLRGHLVLGRSSAGTPLLAAALTGGQVSNDHYPYYEALFSISPSGDLSLRSHHQYFYDVAGLEGTAHWLGGIALFLLLFCIWVLLQLHRRTRRSGESTRGPDQLRRG